MMIRVEAPSRLHFGLLVLPGQDGQPSTWPDHEGIPTIPARHFGGVGLMVDRPGLVMTVVPASSWSARGPSADRALALAKSCCQALGESQAFSITVDRCPQEHVGLGTGTQLGLAVARAIANAAGRSDLTVTELAKLVGRGRRSSLGIHGFAQGGFLVEGGKRSLDAISPLVAHVSFPADWSVLLVFSSGHQGTHGLAELDAFQALAHRPHDLAASESLCRLVLLGMLPAIAEQDLAAFSEALYDFNRRAGEMFRPWQGGTYAHPAAAHAIQLIRSTGVKCVGHSSWGPVVFAVVPRGEADALMNWLIREGQSNREELMVTGARNVGATWTEASS
jgi:beta-ribofuranosylaminobenzene 5'-phosphate synthase